MTTTVTAPKIHHFIPQARTRVEQVKMAISGVPETLPEYRRAQIAVGATEFQFPSGFIPFRVDDVFLEPLAGPEIKRIIPNREAPRPGQIGNVVFGRELYELNAIDGKLTFHKPLEEAATVHWYVMERAARFAADWHTVSLADMLVQGANYIDQDLMPPSQILGKYQGACRCFTEVVSLPSQGLIRKSDDLMGFMYRPRQGFIGLDSIEYLIYNSWGQVSDTYCLTFQMA